MTVKDPHRFVNELDDEVVGRLVDRLESRGRDAVFTRLFEQYATELVLPSKARVLEIGCGTGVVVRALAGCEDFDGTIHGIDQSPIFIEAAHRRVKEAGYAGVVSLEVGDAHQLSVERGSFDLVIAHTLISHVTSPEKVLSEAARALKVGGSLVLFDGDYASLTYDYPDEILARRMDGALAQATFNNPLIMRSLPRMLPDLGLKLKRSMANVVAEVGGASYFRSFAETYVPFVKVSGLVESTLVDQWLSAQLKAMSNGTFFASCNYYTYVAERTELPQLEVAA